LDYLCPQSLKSYLFTGKIDPQNKDVLTMIAEYLFINIDDPLKALNKRDENELKNLITTPAVKYRRPYDVYIEEYPHLASFMASVNGNDYLTDPTGSRRFLPFEVVKIDIEAANSNEKERTQHEIVNPARSLLQDVSLCPHDLLRTSAIRTSSIALGLSSVVTTNCACRLNRLRWRETAIASLSTVFNKINNRKK
jgi:hypothetical protein